MIAGQQLIVFFKNYSLLTKMASKGEIAQVKKRQQCATLTSVSQPDAFPLVGCCNSLTVRKADPDHCLVSIKGQQDGSKMDG